jgi:hypothetical protein
MTSMRGVSAVAVMLLLMCAAPLAAANLTYVLSGELAKNHGPGWPHTAFNGVCQGDADNDCLDDAMEQELMKRLNPRYYRDEDESCPTMYVYAQVRPASESVDVWRVDGRLKWVDVTYFYNYAEDCKIDGHYGDSEHVRYFLYSQDLKTWTLDRATYWRHSDTKTVSGNHLSNIAWDVSGQLGQPNVPPVIAADEDGHGSWEARSAYSDDCTADSTFPFRRTCFDEDEARKSHYTQQPILHNIGGPDGGRFRGPEHWRTGTEHLTVSGSEVYTLRNGIREYWMPARDFCGWKCIEPLCSLRGCAGSLQGKLDTAPFTRQSRPITQADYGAPYTYQCTFTRNGGAETANQVTWTYRGQNPEGHLLYTATDIGGTHYYRLWYSAPKEYGERWILESVGPNDWRGPAQVTCNQFDVNLAGTVVIFSGTSGACSNGVQQKCYGYP